MSSAETKQVGKVGSAKEAESQMLDLMPSTPECVINRVPMDLSQYLLSASPPPSFGFDFMALSLHHSPYPNNNNNNLQQSQTSSPVNIINTSSDCPFHHSFHQNINDSFEFTKPKSSVLKPIINSSCTESCGSDSEGECSNNSSNSRPQSPGRTPKKVSFADHKGLALAQVRFVKEGPDEPPVLNSKLLSLLTHGANAGISSNPPIKLCFPQPASDYMAFRDKVMHNLVSLENVILQDYTVKGTIKVKNISFEKKVFVRVSMDEWESFKDHNASYVPGPGSGFKDSNDTFSFQVDISPSFDVLKKIQFAVCFDENGKEHWDNNGGSNYCITSEDYQSELHRPSSPTNVNPRWLPHKKSDNSWTEFSVWRDVGSAARYY